jgi:anthranilate synthase component 2
MKLVLVDNYDSFTWNLFHYFGSLGADVEVIRNDAISTQELLAKKPEAIVLSPGPCTPKDAGICLDVIKQANGEVPIMGVCLGHQSIGDAYGGDVIRAPEPLHGKMSTITHRAETLFKGIDGPFEATRYHSLIVDRKTLPDCLAVTAEVDGLIMALSHKTHPVHGVQFHPESIASQHGHLILKNFLDLAAAYNKQRG